MFSKKNVALLEAVTAEEEAAFEMAVAHKLICQAITDARFQGLNVLQVNVFNSPNLQHLQEQKKLLNSYITEKHATVEMTTLHDDRENRYSLKLTIEIY